MRKIFMILGGSLGQLEAIKTVKRLGMEVLVVDMNPSAPGFQYADYCEIVSTTDVNAVEKIARKYGIIGSMTISSDIAVPTVCYINEKLGLPKQGDSIGNVVTDKVAMREAFLKSNVASPRFIKFSKEQSLENIVPEVQSILNKHKVIVKPSDSSGSRGVVTISDISQLKDAVSLAESFTRNGKVIIEEFIEGIEIGAQCFSVDGRMELCFAHNDTVSSNLVPVGHSLPSSLSEEQLIKVEQECDNALKSLGIINGPSNVDIIVNKEGDPFIIEIGARIGATKLPELVKYHSGIDLIELTIKLAAGEEVVIPQPKAYPVAAEMLYYSADANVFFNEEKIERLIKMYQPTEYSFYLKPNQYEKVTAIKSGIDVYGHVILFGNSVEDAEKKCSEFLSSVKNAIKS
ncbi:ATP-grasp domain-containing protein [Metabacillus fastidiosus]|uniref:ATP-grasp domain-containing protein n=1 Tax=Metabacillus fastidiosus TaxID=1458 RepID=UPI003D2BEF3E